MAAIDFPNAPVEGQRFTSTYGPEYRYMSGVWRVINEVDVDAGSFVPTVTFSTNGDFAPVGLSVAGGYQLKSDMCDIWFRAAWSNNAFTTANGQLRIGGLPFAAAADMTIWGIPLTQFQGLDLGSLTRHVAGNIAAGNKYMTFRASTDTGAGTAIDATNLPANTTGIVFIANGRYKVVPPAPVE